MILISTNKGDIKLKLFEEQAPETCANFLQYIKDGFYNNTIFHRVIDGFMIQGGGFSEDMSQKTTRDSIKNEADNGISNDIGTIAMARTPDPHSASSQFFINVSNNTFLNFSAPTRDGWGYCVFGKVADGMDVVNEIKEVKTDNQGHHQNVPIEPVVIQDIQVLDTET